VISETQRAWAEIDLDALAQNLATLRAENGGRRVLPVVKADAYGHGVIPIARRLLSEGVEMLAVVALSEAAELRDAGVTSRILLLGAYTAGECEAILDLDATPTASSLDFARAFDEAAGERGVTAPIHVEVDTGMGRLGVPASAAIETIEAMSLLPNIELDGIYTHFAESEAADKSFTMHQLGEFRRILAALDGRGVTFQWRHVANSAACLDVPESLFDCLRPGLALYGMHPAAACGVDVPLRPVLKLSARVRFVQEHPAGHTIGYGRTHTLRRASRVAVVSAGYADGYDRRLSDRAVVTVRGAEAPVLGRISMDLTSIDVTDIPGVAPGDEAVLFSNDPKAPNSVERLAALIDTIPYVLTCGITRRVPRIAKP
jgi:alanine racemase